MGLSKWMLQTFLQEWVILGWWPEQLSWTDVDAVDVLFANFYYFYESINWIFRIAGYVQQIQGGLGVSVSCYSRPVSSVRIRNVTVSVFTNSDSVMCVQGDIYNNRQMIS